MCFPTMKRHHPCSHEHNHCHHRIGHSCKHFSSTARPCDRCNWCRQMSNGGTGMYARVEKHKTVMEGHGLFEGEIQNSDLPTTNKLMEHSGRDAHLESQEGNWLTLKIARPPKLAIPDFDINDINLGLPGSCLQGTHKDGSRFVHHGLMNTKKDSKIFVLKDSDDDRINGKMDVSLVDPLVREEKGGIISSTAQKSVMVSVDDRPGVVKDAEESAGCKDTNIVHARVAEERKSWKDSNVHSPCVQGGMYNRSETKERFQELEPKERSELSNIKERCEPSHAQKVMENWQSKSRKSISSSSQLTMEKEASLAEAAVKVIEIQGLTCHGFKPRKKRMINKKSLLVLSPKEIDDIDAFDTPVGKVTTIYPSDAAVSKPTAVLMSSTKESKIVVTRDGNIHSTCMMQGDMDEWSDFKERFEPLDLKGQCEPLDIKKTSECGQSECRKPSSGSSQISTNHGFKPRKKRMIDKKSLRVLSPKELADVVAKATTIYPSDAAVGKTTAVLMSSRKESETVVTRDGNIHSTCMMQGGMDEWADFKGRFEPLALKERSELPDIKKTYECRQSECRKPSSGSSQISMNQETEAAGRVIEIQRLSCQGFKPRKKRMLDKKSLPVLSPEELDDVDALDMTVDKASTTDPFDATDGKAVTIDHDPFDAAVGKVATVCKTFMSKIVEAKPRMWEEDLLCDLCQKGPSLSMGEWYAWCCGLRLHQCGCSPAIKLRMKLFMLAKKSNKPKKNDDFVFSGTVHKMCALWSSEVYEEGERLQRLSGAVKRGRSLICAACREYGATLGCRVKACRRSFHYPCADELSSKLHCRMWDGFHVPIACRGHRYVDECCTNAKEKPSNLRKWRFRGFVARIKDGSAVQASLERVQGSLVSSSMKGSEMNRCALVSPTPKLSHHLDQHNDRNPCNDVIDISTDSEDENKKEAVNSCTSGIMQGLAVEPSLTEHSPDKQDIGQCRSEVAPGALYHMGSKLLCQDISRGREAFLVPCTNDVDSDPPPVVNYITENRYLGKAKCILDSLLLDTTRAARPCKGCDVNAIDNPHVEPSLHTDLRDGQRENDTRLDWQGLSMLGRLPYDKFGRLLLGPNTKDIVECNRQCPCGPHCVNNELQKGLRLPLEVFKTLNRGWGVRTMEQIPRGQFVVEYIGEVITHDEADVRGLEYDQSHISCLFNADHPDVPDQELLVIDGFRMSNVARFINHSCDGNLTVYRVYTETREVKFCHIGLFALRDIEIGEELSYDYGYATCKETNMNGISTDPTVIRCLCGAKNCRQWLWAGNSR